jgi:hypothetical protein
MQEVQYLPVYINFCLFIFSWWKDILPLSLPVPLKFYTSTIQLNSGARAWACPGFRLKPARPRKKPGGKVFEEIEHLLHNRLSTSPLYGASREPLTMSFQALLPSSGNPLESKNQILDPYKTLVQFSRIKELTLSVLSTNAPFLFLSATVSPTHKASH